MYIHSENINYILLLIFKQPKTLFVLLLKYLIDDFQISTTFHFQLQFWSMRRKLPILGRI